MRGKARRLRAVGVVIGGCTTGTREAGVRSVFEMSGAGEHERDVGVAACLDGLFIVDGAAGLDDGVDACVDEEVWSIAEREEGVGCGDGVFGAVGGAFDGESAGGESVDLSHAGTDEHVIADEADGVGLEVFDGDHAEGHLAEHGVVGIGAGLVFPLVWVDGEQVGGLREDGAGDSSVVEFGGGSVVGGAEGADVEQADVFPSLGEKCGGVIVIAWCDDDVEEFFAGGDGLCGGQVDGSVDGDDSAEGGEWIAIVCVVECGGQVISDGESAGVCVFDDGGGGAFFGVDLADEGECAVGVEEVAEAGGDAVALPGLGDGGLG